MKLGGGPARTTSSMVGEVVLPGPHHQRWVTAKRGGGPGRTRWSWQDQVLVPLTDRRCAQFTGDAHDVIARLYARVHMTAVIA